MPSYVLVTQIPFTVQSSNIIAFGVGLLIQGTGLTPNLGCLTSPATTLYDPHLPDQYNKNSLCYSWDPKSI